MGTRDRERAQLKRILRRAGKRITPQRLVILEAIRDGQGHLDADEIHRRARRKAPNLSLSTVYRTINVLKEVGMIEELRLNGEPRRYKLRDEKEHYHTYLSGLWHGGRVRLSLPPGIPEPIGAGMGVRDHRG